MAAPAAVRPGKAGLVILIILAGLILLYALFCLIAPRFVYPGFIPYAEKEAAIPDLMSGFIPQGVTETEDGTVLLCGYMPGDQASRPCASCWSGRTAKSTTVTREA